MRARYESQSGVRHDDPSDAEISELLSALDGVDVSYASLTAADGSGYVQVGGGPDAFTVERRDVRSDGTFRHWKAARPTADAAPRRLSIGGAAVTVRADEVLDRATVEQVFRAYRHGNAAAALVAWHDLTTMFTP